MNHSICRQYLHIDFNGAESEAKALHGNLSAWCRDSLFPALERTLDRHAPANQYWLLERLEIDAGTVTMNRLEQDLPTLIEQALEKSLRAQTSARTDHEPSEIQKSHQPETEGFKRQPAHQRLISALIYFLTTGTLPWNVKLPEGKNLQQTLLHEWQENPTSIDRNSLLPVFFDANTRKRLVQQFSELFLNTLLERIAPDSQRQLAAVLQKLEHLELPAETVKPFIMQLWETAFEPGNHTETEIIRRAWQMQPLPTTPPEDLAGLLEHLWPGTTGSSLSTANAKQPEKPAPQQKTSGTSFDMKESDRRLPFPAPNGIESDTASLRLIKSALSETHPEANEGIYIGNAGLVILHPFLPQFFNALAIAADDRLVQPGRALCLLHFLITGQSTAPEYELVLPKILCNLPLTRPVEADSVLTQTELEEAQALLQAVIRHWTALKNTSTDGLRGAFLRRSAKIKLREDGDWLLQVENNSYDILLEQLPWGIGAIRLPWMDSMLWVEWMV